MEGPGNRRFQGRQQGRCIDWIPFVKYCYTRRVQGFIISIVDRSFVNEDDYSFISPSRHAVVVADQPPRRIGLCVIKRRVAQQLHAATIDISKALTEAINRGLVTFLWNTLLPLEQRLPVLLSKSTRGKTPQLQHLGDSLKDSWRKLLNRQKTIPTPPTADTNPACQRIKSVSIRFQCIATYSNFESEACGGEIFYIHPTKKSHS